MADMSDPAHRRTLIVGIAVALFLVASVAIAATRGADEPAGQVAGQSGSASDQGSASEDGAAATGDSASAKPGSTAKPKPGTKKKIAPSMTQAGSSSKSAVAPEGSQLSTISATPQQTIGMIVLPEGIERARYEITFQPYGWSPAGPDSGRLVVKIVSAAAQDKGAQAVGKEFAGRNAAFTCTPTVANSIDLGGRYSGLMEIRQRGDVGMLYLTEVQVAD